MALNNIKDFFLMIFLLFIMTSTVNAQKNKMPLQIIPSVGVAIAFLNKDIYSGKPLNFSTQLGLLFSKPLNSIFSIGGELQYNRFKLGDNIRQTYQPFSTNKGLENFTSSTAINVIANAQYSKGGNKGGQTGIALGVGVQRLIIGGNNQQIPDSFQNNQLSNVYQEAKNKYTNLILQLTLQHTWRINRQIGITGSIKVQYAKTPNSITYKKMPSNTDGLLSYEQFIKSPAIETKKQIILTLIPTIGIKF